MLKLIFLIFMVAVVEPVYDWLMSEEEVEQTEGVIEQVEQEEPEANIINMSMDDLVETFYAHSSRFEPEFTMDYVGSTRNLDELLDRIDKELEKKDPYLYGHLDEWEITYEYSKIEADIYVEQSYLTNMEQEVQVDALVERLVASVPATMSTYDKVKFVNDYIVKNTVYSEKATASPYSAYAIAIEGRGVCQGYALFAYKLLQALGVDNYYVVGEVDSGGHAWNLVQVDGAWYHLDTTWNDPLPDRGQEVQYDYFLVSDAQLAKDHTWEQGKFPQAEVSYR